MKYNYNQFKEIVEKLKPYSDYRTWNHDDMWRHHEIDGFFYIIEDNIAKEIIEFLQGCKYYDPKLILSNPDLKKLFSLYNELPEEYQFYYWDEEIQIACKKPFVPKVLYDIYRVILNDAFNYPMLEGEFEEFVKRANQVGYALVVLETYKINDADEHYHHEFYITDKKIDRKENGTRQYYLLPLKVVDSFIADMNSHKLSTYQRSNSYVEVIFARLNCKFTRGLPTELNWSKEVFNNNPQLTK